MPDTTAPDSNSNPSPPDLFLPAPFPPPLPATCGCCGKKPVAGATEWLCGECAEEERRKERQD